MSDGKFKRHKKNSLTIATRLNNHLFNFENELTELTVRAYYAGCSLLHNNSDCTFYENNNKNLLESFLGKMLRKLYKSPRVMANSLAGNG